MLNNRIPGTVYNSNSPTGHKGTLSLAPSFSKKSILEWAFMDTERIPCKLTLKQILYVNLNVATMLLFLFLFVTVAGETDSLTDLCKN